MMKHHNRTPVRQRGVALMLTLLSIMLLSVVAFGLISLTITQNRTTSVRQSSQKAYYIAQIGLVDAMDHIEDQYRSAGFVGGTDHPVSKAAGEGTYVYEIWASPSNDTNSYKVWRITVDGSAGDTRRRLTAWVDMESFAEFSYVTDSDASISGGTIWWSGSNTINGPAHTNGFFSFLGTPQMSDRVTSSNQDDSRFYADPNRYNQGGTWYTDPPKFYQYFSNYTSDYPVGTTSNFSFCGGVPPVPLPEDILDITNNADRRFTTDIKVQFDSTGFVYVTYVEGGVEKTTALDTSKVTVHTTGNVTILGGIVRGKVTVGADGNIEIKNDVVYLDKNIDALGLVSASHIYVNTDPYVRKDLEIDAVLMAPNGTFYVNRYSEGICRGNLKIYGGITQYRRGPVSTVSGDAVYTGYRKMYSYDPKMTFFTPPNYPSTGNVRLFCVQDSAALGK